MYKNTFSRIKWNWQQNCKRMDGKFIKRFQTSSIPHKINRHLTEEGIKTLTIAVNNDLDPRKIIDEALNVSSEHNCMNS